MTKVGSRVLAEHAAQQGVSLNTLLVSYLARQAGRVEGGAAAGPGPGGATAA